MIKVWWYVFEEVSREAWEILFKSQYTVTSPHFNLKNGFCEHTDSQKHSFVYIMYAVGGFKIWILHKKVIKI